MQLITSPFPFSSSMKMPDSKLPVSDGCSETFRTYSVNSISRCITSRGSFKKLNWPGKYQPGETKNIFNNFPALTRTNLSSSMISLYFWQLGSVRARLAGHRAHRLIMCLQIQMLVLEFGFLRETFLKGALLMKESGRNPVV